MTVTSSFIPVVCVVGFHHARGPEIESWFGVEDGIDPAIDNDWSFLPFMALSDGAHAATEDFSYFTLRRRTNSNRPATSVFGISCSRQIDSSELLNRPVEVTRSTVQKAVVAITDRPQFFGRLREKLSMVTGAWFAQRDFTDVDILKVGECNGGTRKGPGAERKQKFQESLVNSLKDSDNDRDQYLGLPLRELVYEYKHQTLVLFKCCLLQPKMLFFGSRCERLCMMQFSLISLIPGLLRNLEDCADPDFDSYEKKLILPTSLKSSERSSLLSYMGLPLQLFGKGSLFGPYTPLQQLDVLADHGTKSYIVGSTNSLLLQQKDRYSDILVNLDETTINITSSSLRSALALSAADRRWIDFLTQTIATTWDENNPSRPKTLGYMGSEEFIRLQFEEYLLALLSSVKYHIYLETPQNSPLLSIEGDPSLDFNSEWVHCWRQTSSFALFAANTDSHLFDIVEPRHPTTGNLSLEDIQRRLVLQIQTLHLDERLASSKEILNKHLTTGQKKVSTAFTSLWADIEAMREAQRNRTQLASTKTSTTDHENSRSRATSETVTAETKSPTPSLRFGARAPDLSNAQASVAAAGQKAGAYISSWGTWASERRKGWTAARTVAGNVGEEGARGDEMATRVREKHSWDSGLGRSATKKEERGGDGIGRLDA
ncbi:late secretory pathway protein avl9 [Sticta canariensis]|nr:late secretory pathway protein avl9 [Sticta canariensis]